MNKPLTSFLLSVIATSIPFASPVASEDSGASAEQWYRDSYAPLWSDPTPENMDAAAGHYASSLIYHGNAGEVTVVDSAKWLDDALSGWEEEQWLRSEMVELESTKINDSTYAFVSKWFDEYKAQENSYSCGWYLVGKTEDGWRITNFADHDCKD